MADTHFQRLAEQAMQQVIQALLTVPTTDPAVARLQGRHQALVESIKMSRAAARIDIEDDPI